MVPALVSLFSNIIDKIFPNAEDANKAKLELLKLQQQGDLAQLEVNKAEASNSNLFVAGWRPAVGWVCCAIFTYTYLLNPLIVLAMAYAGHPAPSLPKLDSSEVMNILLGMLGLGGLRTIEKIKGVSK